MKRTLSLALGLFLIAPLAFAAEPAFVGTWGVSAAQCKVPQDSQGAPIIMTAKGYDQHEAHCAFTSVKKSGSGWKVKASCSVEGDKQREAFTLKVAGGVLTITQGGAARAYKRCR